MGLDARVYCDCFEKGRLKTPPKPIWGVHVDTDGERVMSEEAMQTEELGLFERWNADLACDHPDGKLIQHPLGNASAIGYLRSVLCHFTDRYSIMCNKVIYSGSHSCDYLLPEEVRELLVEMDRFSEIHGDTPDEEEFLRVFEQNLQELITCSIEVNKPLVF